MQAVGELPVEPLELCRLQRVGQSEVDVPPLARVDEQPAGADQQRLEPVEVGRQPVEVGVEQVGGKRTALLTAGVRAQVGGDVDVILFGAGERVVEEPFVVVGPAAVPLLPVLERVLVALVVVAADAEGEEEVPGAVASGTLDPAACLRVDAHTATSYKSASSPSQSVGPSRA